jgi:putative DNA methylase
LSDARIAQLVEAALLEHYRALYILWAYVVMPNHAHALLTPKLVEGSDDEYVELETITKLIKGRTAREANQLLSRTGQSFWQDESYDHWVRDDMEFGRVINYIENNPVKAGLVKRPEEWRWSSASERVRRGWTDVRPLT